MQDIAANAPGYASFTLLAYLFIFLPAILAGFYFARRRLFNPHHKYIMTGVVIANWVLILAVMVGSYSQYVAPSLGDRLGETSVWLPTLHLITGGIAQLLGSYLVILMWTENTRFERILPLRIRNIKTPMRATLVLWTATIALGLALYLTWYSRPALADNDIAPAATEEAPDATEEAPDATEEAPVATEEAPNATEEAGG